jgi:DNA-binding Xre family transcriptional regulator
MLAPMKIETRIREVAAARGLANAYQLQKAAGLSSSMAARLYRDEVEGLTLRVIEALCGALECGPGDLIVRVDSPKAATKKTGGAKAKKESRNRLGARGGGK